MCKPLSYIADWLGEDVKIATRTRVPVLITASPARALAIAQEIAGRRGGVPGLEAFVVSDAGAGHDLVAAVNDTSFTNRRCDEPSTMVLREIHKLSESEQKAMMKALDSRLDRADDDQLPRIITTASVSLFDRVRLGTFDDRLFYRLNIIHILVGPEAGMCDSVLPVPQEPR